MPNLTYKQKTATQYSLKLCGDSTQYAVSFLEIFNYARDNENQIYQVKNTNYGVVHVTCNTKWKSVICEFLKQFGRVTNEREAVIITVNFDVELEEHAEIYGDGNDIRERQFYVKD